MFRQSHSNPFRRNWLSRIAGQVIGRFFLIVDSFVALCNWVYSNTFTLLYRKVATFVFGKLDKWQVSTEEKRNRQARVTWFSRIAGKFNFLIFRAGKNLDKSPFAKKILKPLRNAARIPAMAGVKFGERYEKLEAWLSKSTWLRWLYWLVWSTHTFLSGSYAFTRKWCFSRNYSMLLGGIPAIVLFLPISILLVRVSIRSDAAVASHYRLAARDAFEEQDYDRVQLLYRKIKQLGVFVETAIFESAIANAEKGNVSAAYEDMKGLADDFQFVPAKLWVAKTLMQNKIKAIEPSAAAEVSFQHINDVLRIDPKNVAARVLLADFYRSQGNVAAARLELKKIERNFPPARVMISEIEWQQGSIAEAKSTISSALEYFERQSTGGSILEPTEFVSWASAYVMAGDFERLFDVLQEGREVHSHDVSFLRSSTDLLVRIYDQKREHLPMSLQQRLLEMAIDYSPADAGALERYALLDTKESRSFFHEKMSKADVLPVNVLAALGVVAFRSGDLAAAREHFDSAVKMKPDSASISNNLAWLIANTSSPDLEEAIRFADRAVSLAPDNPGYRETRGQILIKKGRWSDGIKDLELALNGSTTERSQIHRTLAVAYERIGLNDLAGTHRQRADVGGERN